MQIADIADTGYTAITMVKNEAAYILEWVAHHFALGFGHLVVQYNDCDDPTQRMLERLAAVTGGRVHPRETLIRSGGIQRSALRQAARLDIVREADRIYVCDIDEFLTVAIGDGSVQALVAASPEADVITVPWRIYGPCGVVGFRDERVTVQFPLAEHPERKGAAKFGKSVSMGHERFKRLGTHAPVAPEDLDPPLIVVHPGGAPAEGRAGFEIAQVNHYALRSVDAYLVKRDRGRVNHMSQTMGLDYWNRFNHSDVPDDRIRRYDAAVVPLLEELKSDPQLAVLHRKSVRWHRRKPRMLLRDPAFREMHDAILETLPGAASVHPEP